MVNLQDPSLKLSLGYEYNFKEGLYLTGGAYLGFGSQPRSSGSQITEYRSEFGAAPGIFYSGMKIYF
jgi:hypothetical protein